MKMFVNTTWVSLLNCKKGKPLTKKLQVVKKRLDEEVLRRNDVNELDSSRPDPIIPAKVHNDEYIALICAMFGYGRADAIVKFLFSLDFSLLDADEQTIYDKLQHHYYRFQKYEDIQAIFIALSRLKKKSTLEAVFYDAYKEERDVIKGINALILAIEEAFTYKSRGYRFLLGSVTTKTKGVGALKRWMMFLRWMVRKDHIDMGLWTKVDAKDLIMPLDTHTFKVSRHLGLLHRKSYDLQAAIELTMTLRLFDKDDPLKYDFALYRIGQEKIIDISI